MANKEVATRKNIFLEAGVQLMICHCTSIQDGEQKTQQNVKSDATIVFSCEVNKFIGSRKNDNIWLVRKYYTVLHYTVRTCKNVSTLHPNPAI